MNLDDLYVETDRLNTAMASEVADAERQIGSRFPSGYPEYVRQFGEGTLNDVLRVMLPKKVVGELAAWRSRIRDYWFWGEPHPEIDRNRVLNSVRIADTDNGDELCFHPDDPDTLIVLPRDEERMFSIGPGLLASIDWVFTSGVLTPRRPTFAFESHVGRKRTRHGTKGITGLPALWNDLLSMGKHALVDEPSDDYAVVYFPSIKACVVLMELDSGKIDALIHHDEDAPPSALQQIQEVLERAGRL